MSYFWVRCCVFLFGFIWVLCLGLIWVPVGSVLGFSLCFKFGSPLVYIWLLVGSDSGPTWVLFGFYSGFIRSLVGFCLNCMCVLVGFYLGFILASACVS